MYKFNSIFSSAADKHFARALSHLAYSNPFLPERMECEREALGADFQTFGSVWSLQGEFENANPNVVKIVARAQALAEAARERLTRLSGSSPEDLALFEDVAIFLLYHQYVEKFFTEIKKSDGGDGRMAFYKNFRYDAERFLKPMGAAVPLVEIPHFFACFYQLARAFYHIFHLIAGGSTAAAKLRAAAWQSVFTHDMRRYRRGLFAKMSDMTTLVTGPSGTGKDLVAKSIGFSRYIPFDETAMKFANGFAADYFAVNIPSLSATLIESELFGHARGAFTGAAGDHKGWLEQTTPLGSVFLDEIGDLDINLQTKLLRVLQSREFHRVGESAPRRFEGKIIAATNRDLAKEISRGQFRQDLYFRLCSDVIRTPSLAELLGGSADELRNVVAFAARGIAGEREADAVAEESFAWIEKNLGLGYAWPGNFRELEQCLRNLVIRKHYVPATTAELAPREALAQDMLAGALTADELLRCYAALVHAETGNLQETARRLDLDWRTVKAKIL